MAWTIIGVIVSAYYFIILKLAKRDVDKSLEELKKIRE